MTRILKSCEGIWLIYRSGWPGKRLQMEFVACRGAAERIRALDSGSGVSDQQSVGLSPSRDTCVLKQDT